MCIEKEPEALAGLAFAAVSAGRLRQSSDTAATGGDAPEEGSVQSAQTDDSGKVNGVLYKEGLPLVDEGTYSFSIFCDDSSDTGEFYMLNEFKKQTMWMWICGFSLMKQLRRD